MTVGNLPNCQWVLIVLLLTLQGHIRSFPRIGHNLKTMMFIVPTVPMNMVIIELNNYMYIFIYLFHRFHTYRKNKSHYEIKGKIFHTDLSHFEFQFDSITFHFAWNLFTLFQYFDIPLYFYLQDHSTEVLHYDQFMSQRANWSIIYLI